MTALVFRPYQPEDLDLRIQALNMGWPKFPVTRERVHEMDDEFPEGKIADRLVCDSHPAGPIFASAMETYWYAEPGQFQIGPAMNPETGPYQEAYEYLLEHIDKYDPLMVMSASRTDLPRRSEALEKLGFTELERSPLSKVCPADLDETLAAQAMESVQKKGFRLVSFADLEAEGFDWHRPLFEASSEMAMDIPTENPFSEPDFEEELRSFQNRNAYNPQFMHAVMDGDNIAAYTRIRPFQADPTIAFTEFSGTRRAYRRQGLVQAVKRISMLNAHRCGIKEVLADNLENNPMFQINLSLGYQVWSHIQIYRKKW